MAPREPRTASGTAMARPGPGMGDEADRRLGVPEHASAAVTCSVLYDHVGPPAPDPGACAPPWFPDLNLDQVVEAITAGRQDYDLNGFFYTPVGSVAAVGYRHEVFRDLDGTELVEAVRSFAERMRSMRQHLAQAAELRYPHQQHRWFVDAAAIYTDAVTRLCVDLAATKPRSRAFAALRRHLARYTTSPAFTALSGDAETLYQQLNQVTYAVAIKGARVQVSGYDSQVDYRAEVARTFEKFKQGSVKQYRFKFPDRPEMNHVEAHILDLVAQLYPEPFALLDSFCDRHRDFLDPTIAAFDREVQFYLGYLEYMATFQPAALAFCYPAVSDRSKQVSATATFDVALATRLVREHAAVVCNDFRLEDPERIIVVTGPNQGGKTTFARTFGQLNHLASIGCPVAGRDATLFLFDRIDTHFEKEETIDNGGGKLHDDLIRVRAILERVTPRSVVILNEIFTSTTLHDAVFLSTTVLERIVRLDLLCVWVTFVDELASAGETTVSMVSTVGADDPTVRTYKVVRKPADGLSYAAALADKYRLGYAQLRERVSS